MTYGDDEDYRPTHTEREIFEVKYVVPVALLVFAILFALDYFA